MTEPILYKEYDWHDAVALFGRERQARVLCDGQWVIFPEVMLCLTTLGDPPQMPHFQTASRFSWATTQPPLPQEIIARRDWHPTIHLFLRSKTQTSYIYVGQHGPSHAQSYPWKGEYVAADFDLRPALPSRIWQNLGGFDPGNLDHSRIDAALLRLHGTTTTQDRLDVLKEGAEYWHGPIVPADGIADGELAGREMPYPLHWWYRFAGRRKEIMSGQNWLLELAQLKMKDGLLNFYGENQWVYEWATQPTGDDPPVYGRWNSGDPWQLEGMLLSEFLIQVCLFEAIMCHCRYGASAAWITDDAMSEIKKNIQSLPIAPWQWCHQQFWVGNGIFALVADNGEHEGQHGYGVWFGAKTEHPLAFLKPLVSDDWEYVSI